MRASILSHLELEDEPILSIHDIAAYTRETHAMTLTESGYDGTGLCWLARLDFDAGDLTVQILGLHARLGDGVPDALPLSAFADLDKVA